MKSIIAKMVKMFTESMEITGMQAIQRRMVCHGMNGYL